MSTTVTLLPRSARHAAVVNPTYPAPMTATLLTAGRLSQYGFVSRDRLARRSLPAELTRLLQSGPPPPLRLADHRRGGLAESLAVAVFDEHPGGIDNLRDAGVPEGGHGAATGHGLQAGQAEPFVAARKRQAAGRRIQISELLVVHPAQLNRPRHARWRLTARDSGDDELQVGMGDARGRPRIEQGVRILPRVQGTDKEQVASVDFPLVLHPPRGARPGGEDW